MRKIIGVGETILDLIFKNEVPTKAVPGGSVFNGLVTLGRLNVLTAFVSEVGNDKVGRMILSFMKENNMSTEHVDCFPDGKSPISLAFLTDSNDAEYMFYKDYPSQRLDVVLPRINPDDILIFGSYYALNPALREKMTEILDYARERKAIIYYDPNFRKTHAHDAIRLTPSLIENLEYADIVRGSDEDFENIYKLNDAARIYKSKIEFYCPNFLCTRGAQGIYLQTKRFVKEFDVPTITPVSTIGAGDNFNAGILFGLLKYNILRDDLPTLSEEMWSKIVQCGIDFSSEVCTSYDNYVSKTFAEKYLSK
ncbi:carbohydrate kinase family protein [Parabacteroides sp. FAFU027]|uniref:carbohydrate kinase family protein n=1 Tax=Parabacteroides sp. FAFU027 TaxID=2922715 RepID=UPI001FAEADDE|nr:carbohydrate kinase [Parabacteroides sp. FAFU027]